MHQYKNSLPSVLVVMSSTWVMPAGAHHSSAMYDHSKTVTIDGTVKQLEWTNPHVWLWVVVDGISSEPEVWGIESQSSNILSRQGWNRAVLKPGDKVRVELNPLVDGRKGGNLVLVTFADGKKLSKRGLE